MDEEKTHTEAFLQEAMEQYGSTVYRTAISMTANQSDAEDVSGRFPATAAQPDRLFR